MKHPLLIAAVLIGFTLPILPSSGAEPFNVSGIYPHLAMSNHDGECGTGAVVPWAGSLWVVTYPPHAPCGSGDKLYQIHPDLTRLIRPESVGGTHADRLIHRESGKLFIGTYLVSSTGGVEYVWISRIPGRLTGAARHLTDPAHKIYVTDMEEALYEVDVTDPRQTFTYIRDGFNAKAFQNMFKRWKRTPPPGWKEAEESTLFGYHGKGTCSGFGKVFYANNGQTSPQAMRDPRTPAGCLAYWKPGLKNWELIRTNQFTEVTTRDGIYGNEHPDRNPIWALGWDHKSVILTTTADGEHWQDYRLPKGSHSYDGAHGWHTEWPRIREIGEGENYLATMHGTFWKFPAGFGPGNAAGIRPRSTYLKVIGDFCRWGDRVVCGCDDHALSEFTNSRELKGKRPKPRPSESNLWFLKPEELDALGPRVGHGAVWADEAVRAGQTSDPFLFAGYDRRWLWNTVPVEYQIDRTGRGDWCSIAELAPGGHELSAPEGAVEWVRLVAKSAASNAFAVFHYSAAAERIAYAQAFTAPAPSEAAAIFEHDAPMPAGVIGEDAASAYYYERTTKTRWRLPRLTATTPAVDGRICREVATERDLLHVGGIFYELPAVTAGGFKYVKAVAATPRAIDDYDTWKGLLVIRERTAEGRVYRLGALDDVWKLGSPRGVGGPWKDSAVQAGEASDPYLVNGFAIKELTLAVSSDATVVLEADIDGCGKWVKGGEWRVRSGDQRVIDDWGAFAAYWVLLRVDRDCTATAQFTTGR